MFLRNWFFFKIRFNSNIGKDLKTLIFDHVKCNFFFLFADNSESFKQDFWSLREICSLIWSSLDISSTDKNDKKVYFDGKFWFFRLFPLFWIILKCFSSKNWQHCQRNFDQLVQKLKRSNLFSTMVRQWLFFTIQFSVRNEKYKNVFFSRIYLFFLRSPKQYLQLLRWNQINEKMFSHDTDFWIFKHLICIILTVTKSKKFRRN